MDAGSRRRLALAALAGLVLRLAFSLGYWVDQPMTRDEREYLSLARSLARGQGFVYDEAVTAGGADPFGRAPGYPAFIALTGAGRAVTDAVPASLKIAQSIVGAAGVMLLGLVAFRLGGPRAAVAGAAIAAVYPPLVWVSGYALSEGVFWPMGLLTVLLFDRAWARGPRGVPLALAAGLVAGLAVLVRPGMLFFLLLAGPWLLWRRQVRLVTALALGSALVVLPWTARNYAHHGRLVIVASEGGVTFWTGNHPLAAGDGDLAANPQLKTAQIALRSQHPERTEEQMEPVYYRAAIDWIRAHPVAWLGLELRKLFYFVVPVGPSYFVHSTRYVIASIVPYLLVLPAAITGALLLGARRRRAPGLWLLAASALVMALAFFPQERFRIPVVDPVLIVLAASAIGLRQKTVPS
jgi:4-amino-4-deoxy-L-arabinose transferase-like glycosyltransferase